MRVSVGQNCSAYNAAKQNKQIAECKCIYVAQIYYNSKYNFLIEKTKVYVLILLLYSIHQNIYFVKYMEHLMISLEIKEYFSFVIINLRRMKNIYVCLLHVHIYLYCNWTIFLFLPYKSLLKIFLNFFPSKVTCFVYLFMICVSLKIRKMDLGMHKMWITTKGEKMEKISAHNINLSFFRKMLQIFKFFNIYFLFLFQF